MEKDSLGDRCKRYEYSFRHQLPQRMPVLLRVDGKAFHQLTKGCKKPFDDGLIECMNDTAIELCKNIQGAKLAYVQSDEISVLIINHGLDAQPWFDNNIQKMTSISASIASVTFTENSYKIFGFHDDAEGTGFENMGYTSPIIKSAYFDSRVFVVPKEDVNNVLLWRQNDATRNSIQMVARSLYSHKECNNKKNSQLKEMISKKGINFNNLPTHYKRGRCVIKVQEEKECKNLKTGEITTAIRSEWKVDNNIPIFSEDTNYINKLVFNNE